jgi:hypothetical protein
MSVETMSRSKREQLNGLTPEVTHHQSLRQIAPREFNSRRLHHSRSARAVFVGSRLDQPAAPPPGRTTPAASTIFRRRSVEIDRHGSKVEEFDVEGVLNFAERVLPHASDL